jgi:hypothetical protein
MQKPFKAADLVYMMKSLLPATETASEEIPSNGSLQTTLVDRTNDKIT